MITVRVTPYSVSANWFYISLKDAYGEPYEAAVSFVALEAPSNYNYYKEMSILANYSTVHKITMPA